MDFQNLQSDPSRPKCQHQMVTLNIVSISQIHHGWWKQPEVQTSKQYVRTAVNWFNNTTQFKLEFQKLIIFVWTEFEENSNIYHADNLPKQTDGRTDIWMNK